jgi:hypothetical protein
MVSSDSETFRVELPAKEDEEALAAIWTQNRERAER